jgi:hypothetical protein
MIKELYQLGQPEIVEIVDSFIGEEGDSKEIKPEAPEKHPGIEFGRK